MMCNLIKPVFLTAVLFLSGCGFFRGSMKAISYEKREVLGNTIKATLNTYRACLIARRPIPSNSELGNGSFRILFNTSESGLKLASLAIEYSGELQVVDEDISRRCVNKTVESFRAGYTGIVREQGPLDYWHSLGLRQLTAIGSLIPINDVKVTSRDDITNIEFKTLE